MILENRFKKNIGLCTEAIGQVHDNFEKALSFLPLFDIRYLVPGNLRNISNIQEDLRKKFLSEQFRLTIQDADLPANVVGEEGGTTLTYNDAFPCDLSVPRIAGNIAHELGHVFGYFHNSSFFGFSTSNKWNTDKGLHSLPYVLGFCTYAACKGKDLSNVKLYITDLVLNRGGAM